MSETITIICPCCNEEAVIDAFWGELRGALDAVPGKARFTILFVDDGSTDATLARLKAIAAQDPRVRPYAFTRNFGHQAALSAGLDHATDDAVIMMDSDLQHPPALLAGMIQAYREGASVVRAVRTDTEGASTLKRVTSNLFYFVFNALSDVRLTPGAADYVLLSRPAYEVLRAMPERRRFLRGLISWAGFPEVSLPYTAPRRPAGRSKYTALRMLRFATGALFSFTTTPIKLATRAGVLLALSGLLYLAYAVLRHLAWEDTVQGWASTIGAIVLFGGVQLFFIGAIGEYIACIFDEVKGRPLYVLREGPAGDADEARGPRSPA